MTIQTIPTMLNEQRRNHDADVCNKLGYVLHGQIFMLITNFSFGILLSGRFTRETQYTNVKEQWDIYQDKGWLSIFTKIQSVFVMIDNTKRPYIPHLKKRGLRPISSKDPRNIITVAVLDPYLANDQFRFYKTKIADLSKFFYEMIICNTFDAMTINHDTGLSVYFDDEILLKQEVEIYDHGFVALSRIPLGNGEEFELLGRMVFLLERGNAYGSVTPSNFVHTINSIKGYRLKEPLPIPFPEVTAIDSIEI